MHKNMGTGVIKIWGTCAPYFYARVQPSKTFVIALPEKMECELRTAARYAHQKPTPLNAHDRVHRSRPEEAIGGLLPSVPPPVLPGAAQANGVDDLFHVFSFR